MVRSPLFTATKPQKHCKTAVHFTPRRYLMGKKRYLAAGLVLGICISAGVQVFAQDAVQKITASVRNDYTIQYNGETQALPPTYHIVSYQDRTYLPIRYISDLLGADIDWDGTTNTITIDQKKTPSDTIDTTVYGKLPQSVETLDYRITAAILMEDREKGDRLYLNLKNKCDTVLRLDQSSVVFDIDGKKYPYSSVDSLNYDKRWYIRTLDKDEEMEGYLRLPEEARNAENITITLHLIQDDEKNPIPVTFRISTK